METSALIRVKFLLSSWVEEERRGRVCSIAVHATAVTKSATMAPAQGKSSLHRPAGTCDWQGFDRVGELFAIVRKNCFIGMGDWAN